MDSTPARGAVLVQQTSASTDATVATLSASFAHPTIVGDLLVIVGASTSGPLDRKNVTGGGVTQWAVAAASPTNANMEIWYGVVSSASSAPVAIGLQEAQDLRLNVTEWSGLVATQLDALDGTGSQSGTASPALASPIDTHAAALVVFGVSSLEPSSGFGTPSDGPWTAMDPIALDDRCVQLSWYQNRPAATSLQPMVSVTGDGWDAAIAAFKVAP
jgi:hypothetical protein